MPTGLDQAEATRLVNAMTGKVAYPAATAPIRARLTTTVGTATTAGTEVANAGGSAYAPQDVSAATPAAPGAVNGVLTSNAAITYTNMPAATVRAIEIYDATPRRVMFGSLTAEKTTALGDSLTIASGALSISLNNTL